MLKHFILKSFDAPKKTAGNKNATILTSAPKLSYQRGVRTSLKIQAFSAHPRREEMATRQPSRPLPTPSTSGLCSSAWSQLQTSQPAPQQLVGGGLQQASPHRHGALCTLGCEESLLQGALRARAPPASASHRLPLPHQPTLTMTSSQPQRHAGLAWESLISHGSKEPRP